MNHDSLGDRMKRHENIFRSYLPSRFPILIRLDGKSFHSFTRSFEKPFDSKLIEALNLTAIHLCQEIQGVKLAYLQSDEISLLIYNPKFETQPWFDNNIQKMVSVAAGMASAYLTSLRLRDDLVVFDARAFVVPLDEVVNGFEWRQQDASRNSIQMLARAHFSHKECDNKSGSELQEMLFAKKSINWNDLPTHLKRGRCVVKETFTKDDALRTRWVVDNEIPIFHANRDYIEQFLKVEDSQEQFHIEVHSVGEPMQQLPETFPTLNEARNSAKKVDVGTKPLHLRVVDQNGMVRAWISRNGFLPKGVHR